VLDHAVEDDPGGVVVLLLRWAGGSAGRWCPCLGPRHALAAGEVEESELLMRPHELGTNGRLSNAILPVQSAFLIY
jgi:hypothetical protein